MGIVFEWGGERRIFEGPEVLIGRQLGEDGLELAHDQRVSRPADTRRGHARVWLQGGDYWLEDLGSANKTFLDGEPLEPVLAQWLRTGDVIVVGRTELRVTVLPPGGEPADPSTGGGGRTVVEAEGAATEKPGEADGARRPGGAEGRDEARAERPGDEGPGPEAGAEAEEKGGGALFRELSAHLIHERARDALLRILVEQAVRSIPGAERGAVVLGNELRLVADHPRHFGASTTFARQAMETRRAFCWPDDERTTAPWSVQQSGTVAAIYAPLLWRGQALGVICVDSPAAPRMFDDGDRRLLEAVAGQAAAVVARHELEEELARAKEALAGYGKLVPPPAAKHVLEQHGVIEVGGAFRHVTVLFSDVRGFTRLSSTMMPHEVRGMIHDYLDGLVPVLIRHGGTIDKYVGDAIMAVFEGPPKGPQSPSEWAECQRRAVRAALEMQRVMEEVNARRESTGRPVGGLGVGIHCGEVMQGFIGAAERMEFTVLGETVNRASRYCDGARGGEVLVSYEVKKWVWQQFSLEATTIPTKHEGELAAFLVLGENARPER